MLDAQIAFCRLMTRQVSNRHLTQVIYRPALQTLAERVCREGVVADPEKGEVGVPLYVRGAIAGLIAAQFPLQEAAHLEEHCDTLAAVATR